MISIIVPMYNVEKYISKCIKSLLNQNIEKELILIDDGSTDNTYKIAREYENKYPFIKLIHQENKGQSIARNIGINESRGDYIFFCDADDYVDDDSLIDLYELCKKNDLDILKTGWKTINNTQILCNIPNDKITLNKVITTKEYFKESIFNWYNVVPINGFFKKTFILENNILFPENIQFEDNTFHLMVLLKNINARIMQIDSLFYNVQLNENSTTKSKPQPKIIFDQLENARLMNQFINAEIKDDELKEVAKASVSSLVFTMTGYFYRLEKKYRNDIYNAIPKDLLNESIRHPQTRFQQLKLIAFTYFRPLMDLYERVHIGK